MACAKELKKTLNMTLRQAFLHLRKARTLQTCEKQARLLTHLEDLDRTLSNNRWLPWEGKTRGLYIHGDTGKAAIRIPTSCHLSLSLSLSLFCSPFFFWCNLNL